MGAVRLGISLAARAIIFAILGMMAWAVLPFALGWQPTTVMTGSMEPRISAGDVVIARPVPAGTASLGHVLLVDDPDRAGKLRLHRYVEDAPDGGLILRGDANESNDSSPVAPEAVHGVAVLRVPYVGLPVVWIAEKNWGNLAALFVAVSVLTVAAAAGSGAAPRDGGAPGKPEAPRDPQRPPRRHSHATRRAIRRRVRAAARRTTAIRTLLCLASLPVLVTPELLMAAPAHAAFSAATPSHEGSFAALSKYPCLSPTAQDTPTLFYAFNEASGPAAEDSSAYRRNGTLLGATGRVAGSCAAGDSPALALDGATGYVSTSVPAAPAPDTFSVEIWFKTTTTAGGKLIGFGDKHSGASDISDRHLYLTDAGAIAFGTVQEPGNSSNPKPVTVISKPGYNDGRWHQATGTLSAAGMTLYVDGRQIATEPMKHKWADYTGYWRIGYDAMDLDKKNREWPGSPSSLFFAGSIDNAAVYPTALSADRVQAHFAAGR
jgi:signal peptidase I